MVLKTDFKNAEYDGLRKYREVRNDDGAVSFQDVTDYRVAGSQFGATEINATNAEVNKIEQSLGNCKFERSGNDFYIVGADSVRKKLGREGTAVAGDVLTGKTFTNANDVNIAGTMPNRGGTTVAAASVTQDADYTYLATPEGYYSAGSKVRVANSDITDSEQTINFLVVLTPRSWQGSFNVPKWAKKAIITNLTGEWQWPAGNAGVGDGGFVKEYPTFNGVEVITGSKTIDVSTSRTVITNAAYTSHSWLPCAAYYSIKFVR